MYDGTATSSFNKRAQQRRLSKVGHLAGPRYTPKLNVEVSIASVFDGLGRTRRFYDSLKKPAMEIIQDLRGIRHSEIDSVAAREHKQIRDLCGSLVTLILTIPNAGVKQINFRKIISTAQKAKKAVHTLVTLLREQEAEDRDQRKQETQAKPATPTSATYIDPEKFRSEKHYLHKIHNTLTSIIAFSKSNAGLAANNPAVLLTGIAGSGKTHFLCDLARQRLRENLPTLIFLGEEFNSKNPWTSILGLLGARTTADKLLSALNQYAFRRRTRGVIIIDALNESVINRPRWELLSRVKRYKHLGLVLSVRSGFEESTIPQSILSAFVRVVHEGFALHEWEAVTKFFTEYKLPLPEVPILFPEFRIPLFLKIFCQSYKKSGKPIKGHFGFTRIFEDYVVAQGDEVLSSLGEKPGRHDGKHKIWDGIIKELALFMGENGTDRVPEQKAISIAAREFPSRAKRVLGLLQKFWLITKVPRFKKFKAVGFDYRFPYQKFSDHLIVRNLLTKHLDLRSPRQSFKKGTVLHETLRHEWLNQGLIEALAVQIPERLTGSELVHVAPKTFRSKDVAKETFLESLVWRDLSLRNGKPKFIRLHWVLKYLNKEILPYYGGNEKILETVITVSAIPNHPMNARMLHGHLLKFKMPQRDAFWLPFLNNHYSEEGAINRLITWAWDGGDKSKISDVSVRLAGITLAWFLASSNRFLRDRATKALVALFTAKPHLFVDVLHAFRNVKDPYIHERLYAVAYGCILRTNNAADVSKLAIYLYRRVFRRSPPHILLRDYARGAIEAAIRRNPQLITQIDLKRIRPTYGSSFPLRIPSLAYLKRKYYSREILIRGSKRSAYGLIWHSLMYSNGGGIADFGNYVVNSTLHHWSNLKLPKHGRRQKTVKELHDEFIAGLSKAERRTWQRLERIRRSIALGQVALSLEAKNGLKDQKGAEASLANAENQYRTLEASFIASLNRRLRRLYRQGVVPYRDNLRRHEDLDYAAVQRLIFKRVIDLGWDPELFAEYDSTVNKMGREERKSERIGKKYQWIAFHEILGRLSDNFLFRSGWQDAFTPYEGPWQIWKRDIDPSCLLKKTSTDPALQDCWWLSTHYRRWRPSLTNSQWMRISNDLPDQKRLLEPKPGWILLDGYFTWEQPPLPGEERFDSNRRHIWYIVRSYLTKRRKAKEFYAWAKKQDFMGGWMPESITLNNTFLYEFPYCTAYQEQYDLHNRRRWISVEDKRGHRTGFKVLHTTERYNWGESYDCSVDSSVGMDLPAKEIVQSIKLKHGELPGEFRNEDGELIVVDPSVFQVGPSVLLMRKNALLKFLKEKQYEISWCVVGEKIITGLVGGGQEFYGRLEVGGAFRMTPSGRLVGKPYKNFIQPARK